MFWNARKRRATGGAVLALGLVAGLTACDSGGSSDPAAFPDQSIDFILPSSPGGSTDLIGRAFGNALETQLGGSITPVNREGANGAVGGKDALNQDPDGYTIVMLFQSLMSITPLAVEDANPISFDDMDVLGALTVEDYVLVVNTDETDAETFDELISQDRLSFGTAGVGTGGQLSQALILNEANVDYTDVPMDGGAPAVTALLGGQVDAVTVQVAEAAPYIEDGSFAPLMTFNDERSEFLPDVPTAVESGYDVTVTQKRFLAAPTGIPAEVRDTYAEAIEAALQDESFTGFLEENYISGWETPADEVPAELQQARSDFESKLEEYGITLNA